MDPSSASSSSSSSSSSTPSPFLRRDSKVEALYREAFACAERAKSLESVDQNALDACEQLDRAVHIFSRLVIVECAAKRELIQKALDELKAKRVKLSSTSEFLLQKAMQVHEQAKQLEQQQQQQQQQATDTQGAAGQTQPAKDQVFQLYVTTGDWYMKAYNAMLATNHPSRQIVKDQLQYVIEYASRLKRQTFNVHDATSYGNGASSPERHRPLEPSVEEEGTAYSPEELDVLRRSSLINDHLFVPFVEQVDSQEEFFNLPKRFEDPDGFLKLSKKQQSKFGSWQRPFEFQQICDRAPQMIAQVCPHVVKQDVVTDCSFVASLCIAASFEERFQKQLITNIISPLDHDTKKPVYNPMGKYMVKLWANGVPRKVVIDDLLPVSKTGQLLCSCTTTPNELWVSIIEKAYLKLHGGYDYPGGNSGVDLFALTGWIPESVALKELTADQENRVWQQLKSAFHYGDCLVTITTDALEKYLARKVGLVPLHVYAVLNVYEKESPSGGGESLRLLQVKNPWRHKRWRGPYSNLDTEFWQSSIGQEIRQELLSKYPNAANSRAQDEDEDDGLFWIDFDSVKTYYESLYLNWNPSLFRYKYVLHKHWPVECGPSSDSFTIGFNPQFSLRFRPKLRRNGSNTSSILGHGANSSVTSSSGGSDGVCTVWVLLTRHVQDVGESHQFLTLHVYAGTSGKRVFYNQNAFFRGTYSNNPHTLVSLDFDFNENPEPTFTLVASQFEKFAPLDYTLSVFSTTDFVCEEVPFLPLEKAFMIEDAWTQDTAGGRPLLATFMNNPQYHFQLQKDCQVVYFLMENTCALSAVPTDNSSATPATAATATACSSPHEQSLTLNLRLLHGGERVTSLNQMETQLVATSGDYRPGFCYIEVENLQRGDYTLVASSFCAGSMGNFRLRILSTPVDGFASWQRIEPEGFGLNRTTLEGKWDSSKGTAAGCFSYGCYTFNPKYLLTIPRGTNCVNLFVRLRLRKGFEDPLDSHLRSDQIPKTSLNVTIYESDPQGHLLLSTNPKQAACHGLASSEQGTYVGGNPSGVRTPMCQLLSGNYVIIPSTYVPKEDDFELSVFADQQVGVRCL